MLREASALVQLEGPHCNREVVGNQVTYLIQKKERKNYEETI